MRSYHRDLSVDQQGMVWWIANPDFRFYRITPDGQVTLFAQNIFFDPGAIAVDSQGNVYFTSPNGIYRIYR